MSSKDWIDQAVRKPAKDAREDAPTNKRTGLAQMLLKIRKEKG